MASDRTDDANSRTSSLPSNSNGSQASDDIVHCELKGWLFKRSKYSHTWKKQWFLLKSSDLLYGDKPEHSSKRIPLESAEISEIYVDKRPHSFRIKPKDHSRSYYIQADSESLQNNWMQAICFAKAAGNHGDKSESLSC